MNGALLPVGADNIARSVSKGGKLGDSISAVGIFHIVNNAGVAIDKPELAPHDLRRSYAQIGYEAGIAITQISRIVRAFQYRDNAKNT